MQAGRGHRGGLIWSGRYGLETAGKTTARMGRQGVTERVAWARPSSLPDHVSGEGKKRKIAFAIGDTHFWQKTGRSAKIGGALRRGLSPENSPSGSFMP
jgi:hypothetical protein